MSACLSGPGQYQGNCIFAVIPQGTAPGRTEYVEVNFMGTAPRTQDWPGLWGFPFHVSCWNILSSAWPQDPPRIQAVFDLLRSFPARDGLLNFGHKYGKNDIHLEIGPGWEPLILPERELSSDEELDPAEPISLSSPLFTSAPDNDTNSTQVKISMTGPGEDPFSSLPIELRTYIVENLSSIDVARLREVSRAFAVYVLPDSFWKSRFQPGNECGFILGPDQDTVRLRGQWKSLYSFIKPLSGLPEFKNRRRVLQLASSFRQMVHEASSKCYGTPFGIIDHHNYFVSTPIYCCDPLRYFRTGRRLLRQRIIELSVDRPAKFSFYAVLTYGLLHLSGIQLETEHSGISRLGYCSDKHAILLGSVEETLITGFCLAQDERGIRGIRVRLFDESVSVKDEVWSQWFGDHLCLPQRRLVLSSIAQESIGSIFGGFDVCAPEYLRLSMLM
jgi:hypothetical protein